MKKEEAISNFIERKKEEAKKVFQSQVDAALSEISTLSNQLKTAKKRLLELKYKEPEQLDI